MHSGSATFSMKTQSKRSRLRGSLSVSGPCNFALVGQKAAAASDEEARAMVAFQRDFRCKGRCWGGW